MNETVAELFMKRPIYSTCAQVYIVYTVLYCILTDLFSKTRRNTFVWIILVTNTGNRCV